MILYDGSSEIVIKDPTEDTWIYDNGVISGRNRNEDYSATIGDEAYVETEFSLILSRCKNQDVLVKEWINTYAGSMTQIQVFGTTYDVYLNSEEYSYSHIGGDYVTLEISMILWAA